MKFRESPQIQKLYVSNFLMGLVFWYGIEKLFMGSIGINAVGIAAATAAVMVTLVLLDIPAGMLADKWSRKGVLVISAATLAIASLLTGESHGLALYIVGDIFYGIYVITSGGTYQAIIYDSLHEEGRAQHYSRVNGRIYALFLFGATIGDLASGFLAHHFGFRLPYLLTIIPCLINIAVILSLHEPTYHKSLNKERMLHQLKKASVALLRVRLVRSLTVVMTLLAVVELFKLEFSQLYMLRYVTSTQAIGILWAAYAFAMSLGSFVAHRFSTRIHTLIIFSVLPLILMSYIDNWFSLVLFMVQAIAAAALLNQIETRIQDNTPSAVRASVLSVVSTLGRVVSIPFSFVLGGIFTHYNSLVAVRVVALVAVTALLFWWAAMGSAKRANDQAAV